MSSRSAGARALCLHLVTIAPGTRGVPHVHDGHESAIYTVSGETERGHPQPAPASAGLDAFPWPPGDGRSRQDTTRSRQDTTRNPDHVLTGDHNDVP